MYSQQLLDHFTNPRNVGELPEPAVTVQVENAVCGDILKLSALAQRGVLIDVRYKVRGCTASIAAGSVLTEWLLGRPLANLPDLTLDAIEARLGEVPSTARHALRLCLDGSKELHRALSARAADPAPFRQAQ